MQQTPSGLPDAAPVRGPASWSLHLSTGELRSNPARALMMGFEPAETTPSAEWWDRTLHPDDRAAVLLAREGSLQQDGSGYRSQYRARHRDGQWITLLEIGCIERDASGAPQRIEGVLLDVTLEQAAQDRMQTRLTRLAKMLDNTRHFEGLYTQEGIPLEINRAALLASGLSADTVFDRPLWKTALCRTQSEAELEWIRAGFAAASNGEDSRFQLRATNRETGDQHIIDITLQPVFDDARRVTEILSEGRDITDIVDARQALATLENRLAVAESSANLGLWEVDLLSGKGWANDQYFRMLGYEPNEFSMDLEGLVSMVHPDDIASTVNLVKELRSLPELRFEFRMRAKDGRWHWIHTVGRTLTDPQGRQRMAGVHLDITERKETESRRHSAERLESVGKLAAGVAHEINTPVQFVSDSIYFVRDGLYELLALTDRLRALASRDQCNVNAVAALSTHLPYLVDNLPKALERSLEGLKRVSEIVGSMRELAHPDRPEMSDTDVNHVVQTALVVARAEYKYVADVTTDLGSLPAVRCHSGELNQVILNLIVNASHAIADLVGDSGRKGSIEVSTRREGDWVRISVADSGAGIPETIRHRIFEPFFTTKDVGRGTGQGLAISHNIIVQRHGGAIDFESVVGKGTVFHLRLPCAGSMERVA
jgi:PAS domain S-box-containing protein